MKKWTMSIVILLASVALVLAACGSNDSKNQITLAYVAWDSEIASTNVVKTVLEEKLGYTVKMLQVDAGPMYAGISDGSADAMVAAWLPITHEEYYEKYSKDFEDLGPNLDGAKLGLVVPDYMDIQSIEDLKNPDVAKQFKNQIIGIEPGAGLMMKTEEAIKDYDLSEWKLITSSSATMAVELKNAYDKKEPIIVTGWTPHWKFATMNLKYLEDPKTSFGEAEQIHTLARKGLKDDHAKAYQFLDQFNWTPDDMANVMVQIEQGTTPEAAAAQWVKENEAKVNEWLQGIE